ncbi:hypothetical protein C8J57DRAFT_1009404, partial [Mycena rebaudengoi]
LNICNVEVDAGLGLGSDHVPITFGLDLQMAPSVSSRFNAAEMDVDKFLAILSHELGMPPPVITCQAELDAATDLLCEAVIVAVGASTPKRRPSLHAKRWWSPALTVL